MMNTSANHIVMFNQLLERETGLQPTLLVKFFYVDIDNDDDVKDI